MSQVNTEETNLASAPEVALGTMPVTAWRNHQPTTIGKFGNVTKKISRNIISSLRQREQGRAVGAVSGVDVEFDLTKDALDRDAIDIFKALEKFSGGTGVGRFFPTVVVDGGAGVDSYTVAAAGALQARTLIFVRGCGTTAAQVAANNGLKEVAAGAAGGSITVATGTLVAEAATPANSTLEVAGWRGLAGDIGIDASGNLTAATANFTTMGLNVGQWIWLGGVAAGNQFANNLYRGWARIKSIAAALLTLELRNWTVGAPDAGAGKSVDIYWGSWLRNVGSLHADFTKPSRTTEWTLPKLGAADVTEYWYSRGLMNDTYQLTLAPSDKVTVQANYVGTITDDPVTVQATGANAAFVPTPGSIGMITTGPDVARLRLQNVDETGISTDFKHLVFTFGNNVTPEDQLGTYGASKLNVGAFYVEMDATIIMASDEIVKAVRDDRKAGLNFALRNPDGAALIDVPHLDVMDCPPDAARNESVRIKAKLGGVRDQTLNYTCSMSRLPFCPAS